MKPQTFTNLAAYPDHEIRDGITLATYPGKDDSRPGRQRIAVLVTTEAEFIYHVRADSEQVAVDRLYSLMKPEVRPRCRFLGMRGEFQPTLKP